MQVPPFLELSQPSHKTLQDLALSTANSHHIRYVLAQDPDSDRFAAAEKRHVENGQDKYSLSYFNARDDGTWKVFTGDQLGALFAAWVLRAWKASGKPLGWSVVCDSSRC